MTALILNWHQAWEAGRSTCGGKGYHLALLYRYGFPVSAGGYLSHGAIVARAYGLPAVVNIPALINRIKDGEPLAVDGDAATARRIP
jgi:phosphoenolpyruvate-protein kinase (PTS system EI component)